MEVLNGHDENCSMQFVNSYEDHRAMINGITFLILEEVISLVMGLSMKGWKWQKVTRMADDVSLQCLFVD